MADAYVGLGSNLGDRAATLREALSRLGEAQGVEVVAASPFVETAPVGGPPGQPKFLNAAARLSVELAPDALLDLLLRLEAELGRERAERWGPRTLDLDLLLYDDLILDTARLTVPHPRMHEREFVLEPLAQIAPAAVHPALGRTVRDLLETLKARP